MPTTEEQKFEAPGPGTWVLDTMHYPNPMSRFVGEFFADTMSTSINSTFARHGRLTNWLVEIVHGYIYMAFGRIGSTPGSTEPPSMNNPVVAERVERGRQAVISKIWKQDLERWDNEVKPDSIARNVKLALVDVDSLDHDGLIDHLHDCRENFIEMIRRHHMFSGIAESTASLFFLDAKKWTGLELEQLILLLDGASPISTGFTPEFEAVVLTIGGSAEALVILNSDATAEVRVDQLKSITGPVGDAMGRFLLMDGHRLANSFDLQGQCLFELPGTIVDRISDAVENGFKNRSPEVVEDTLYARSLVPEEHKKAFDVLLSDARKIARIKDERGVYGDV